jgi:lipid A 3-O-deacylase
MRAGTIACWVALSALTWASRSQAAVGILDEGRFGVTAHDSAIGGDHREAGADFNLEALFVSPGFLAPIWAPRPHIGVNINSAGGNSIAYAGLTWQYNFLEAFFAELGLGGAIHDGPNFSTERNHKGLGTRLLFHESVELGYRLSPKINVGAFLDHVSNANIGRSNPGITNIGLRAGYVF